MLTLTRLGRSPFASAFCGALLVTMTAEAGMGSPRRTRSMLFLRPVGGAGAPTDLESSIFSPHGHAVRAMSPELEDKIHPLRMGIVGRTRLFIRKSLDAMWPSAAPTAVRARPSHTRNRRGSSNVAVSVSVGALLAHVNNDEEAIGESRLDRIGVNMTRGGSCPVDLIAPCAVPSAALKKDQLSREEGILVPASFTVGDCIDFISRLAKLERYKACRSLERIFVTDCGRLVGYVTSMDLLVNARPSPLGSIVRPCEVVVRESDEYDDAIAAMRAKGLTYAPVVDDNYVVSGIITPADMMDEMEMEATDDVMRFSGSGGGESYFGTSLVQLVSARAWWLISLLMLQSLSSVILTRFSALIERHIVIALFLTMLTGTAGNAGNQSSAMVIRGLATGEINRKNGWRVITRELKAALMMSVLLGIASFVRVYFTPGSTLMATVSVTISMCITVIGACLMGVLAPLLLDRMGLDPCNCASPALATLVDVSGVLILCAISGSLLG